jgi:hypothetical protein
MNLVTLPALGANSPGDGSSSLSTGAIVGIAVGGAVVIIALVAALVWFCILKKKRKNKAEPIHEADGTAGTARHNEAYEKSAGDREQIHETDGRFVGHELGEENRPAVKPYQTPVEMPANEVAASEAHSMASTPFVTPMTSLPSSPFSFEATGRSPVHPGYSERYP